MYSNIFYFKRISKIGGTEQFLYEIAKKYSDYDITVFYDEADIGQLRRLRKYVRCLRHIKGQIVECHKAFFNFNADMIDDVKADEYWFVSHAIYQELGYTPPIGNDKFTHYLGVSEYSSRMLEECASKVFKKEINCIPCYNPLTLEEKEKVPIIVCAGRLEDKTKGGQRTLNLIDALDKYCEKTGRHYLMLIFTNPVSFRIPSKNVCIMQPRVDVRPYIAMADFVAQVSNNMETYCYTDNEALGYGVPIISTPLTVLEELGVTEDMMIKLEWDCSNIDEVARQVFEREFKPFHYDPPKDDWLKILELNKSTYKEELEMKAKVRCISTYTDIELSNELGKKTIIESKPTDKYYERIISRERAEYLADLGYVEIVEFIKDEPKKEDKKLKPKTEKAKK